MRQHIDIVGILFMAWGGLQLLGAIALFLLMGVGGVGLGALGASAGDEELLVMGGIYGVMGLFFGVLIAVMAVPSIVVGIGIRRRRPWARIGGFIIAALSLTSMPLGTILGIYAFMTLLDKEVALEFETGGAL